MISFGKKIREILLGILAASSFVFAGTFNDAFGADQPSGLCKMSAAELSKGKKQLLKKFKKCQDTHSVNSVRILGFKVWEGESGVEEQKQCFFEYQQELLRLNDCAEQSLENGAIISLDEFTGYILNMGTPEMFVDIIDHYDSLKAYNQSTNVVDPYDLHDEEYLFQFDYTHAIEGMVASRELKEVSLLYVKYLKHKYSYCESGGFSRACKYDEIEKDKEAFLRRYPNSRYTEFVNNVIVDYKPELEKIRAGQIQEKDAIKAQRIAQELAEGKFHMGFTLFGIYDKLISFHNNFNKEFDATTMLTFGLKWQYRRFFTQFHYGMSFGNSYDGAFAERNAVFSVGASVGNLKYWSMDFLLGLNSIGTSGIYSMSNSTDFEPFVGIQLSAMIPVSKNWDIVLMGNFNFAEFYFTEQRNLDHHDEEPFNGQLQFGLGVGIRFWKPKTSDMYDKKYLDLINEQAK